MELPRRLIDCNPRSTDHKRRALEIITHLQGGVVVTSKIAREIEKHGIRLKNKKLIKNVSDADAVVCEFFFLERGLMFPNNVITVCADCRTAIQLRPHTDSVKTKICIFCAANRLLADHWTQQRPTQE